MTVSVILRASIVRAGASTFDSRVWLGILLILQGGGEL